MVRWLIFFLTFTSTAFCQQLVEGIIVDDETGEPIPFASVGILGTSKGTSSNLNGQFSLSATEPFILMVTCVGYETLRIKSGTETRVLRLRPMAIMLDAIVVSNRPIDAKRIIRKAFSTVPENCNAQPFLQNFFYRHYCKDNDAYGRLIEASVDVWKNKGYQSFQKSVGEKEEIRVTQLRRSLDKTVLAQGHEPISIGEILETDLVGYQTTESNDRLSFYNNVSNLKSDLDKYSFTFKGITSYDGQEVYQITYSYKDSLLTTSGAYSIRAQTTGSLFITIANYAFVKREEVKSFEKNTTRTSTYYRKYDGLYYPYHFVLEGESQASDSSRHAFHIELMSVEIRKNPTEKFKGRLPGREELLSVPYDSVFWTTNTILKTTPLEDDIIRDLGGGTSLNKQFYRYKQYEMNVHDGGINGEEKFNWFREDSKDNRILYLVFWSGHFKSYLLELELAKQLHKQYRSTIAFVLLSLEDNEEAWQKTVQRYNLTTDGMINYRIGSHSQLANSFQVDELPAFVLVARNGEVFDLKAKRPSDPLLQQDFKSLATKP